MSETRDSTESSDQEMPELSEDEQIDEVAEDEDFSPLIENPMGQNSELQTEAFAGASREPASVEQTTRSNVILPDLKNVAEDPGPLIEKDEASDHHEASDIRTGEESKLDNVQLENGGRSTATDNNAAHSEEFTDASLKQEKEGGEYLAGVEGSNQSYTFNSFLDGDDSGTEEEQAAFMKELENFFRERSMEFKPPKFYGEGLNCLKLWRAVTRLGGYDQVTSCKLWRQVGESFKPPKTCTTVSWSFRIFYEKALLEYEKHKIRTGELQVPISSLPDTMVSDHQVGGNQSSGSGRARRDAAARAMQGWHSQRLLGNGEVGDPIIKDKSAMPLLKRDKHLKSIDLAVFVNNISLYGYLQIFQMCLGLLKRKKTSGLDRAAKVTHTKVIRPQGDSMVVDVGAPADWVKINVRRTKDCFEVYALVPGLLREEVHVQSDPAGRLVISGEPEQPDNPWGVTPFKKVITLPSRIDPHQTSAVVTLHGQLFVRAPFEQSDI
ncbi:AT-rich interactive domain-containing protein 5 isoform X1 [Elaeis guineensis]|uniref:AT-rich interactive domain-containing protein 5 isoform X1 n=1 Tax=Elaeis guineensis var. tenera TaxID=51953 RepID=A0A6I9RTH7_ELAGV|nr:AT-rich interactive domain-containing protein 5 isoform X1 [Elaeis guineensis]